MCECNPTKSRAYILYAAQTCRRAADQTLMSAALCNKLHNNNNDDGGGGSVIEIFTFNYTLQFSLAHSERIISNLIYI